MIRSFLVLLVLCFLNKSFVVSQADGWKMTDRFFGFRFEMGGDQLDSNILEHVQAYADKQSCFGWIQKGKNLNYVGEVRCSKTRGSQFLEWLQQIKHVTFFESLVYADTKIRLHFSHFKIVEPTRETCFLDKPHQCIEAPPSHDEAISTSSSRNEF